MASPNTRISQNGLTRLATRSRPLEDENPEHLLLVAGIRVLCILIWSGAIIYSTYQIYKVAEVHMPWQSDPIMNEGPFTKLLGRGRDTTDYEWVFFTKLFCKQLIFWYILYILLIILLPSQFQPAASLLLSIAFLSTILNFVSTIVLFLQPILYWILLQQTRSKVLIWIITLGFLSFLGFPFLKNILLGNYQFRDEYYFDIAFAWTYARCISFTFDRWNRSDNSSMQALFSILSYCFYFPTVIHGPLILYNRYESDILNNGRVKNPKWKNSRFLMKSGLKLFFILIVNEAIIHYIYFRPLSLTLPILKEVNLWALCGTVYWLGQFFFLKYYVMYGSSTCIAEFDGVEMPPLPRCPSYIHRYSVLWKDFDRGLYNFLVQYTYLPVIQALESSENGKRLPVEIRKLIASLFSYVYVFAWHGVWFPVFVWSLFNFIGITIERIGSLLKRMIEARSDVNFECSELGWDGFIEPVVTIPLAGMSILNSVVFCGSLEAAMIMTERLLWTNVNESYAFLFLFCFTQIGVTVRTWPKFSSVFQKTFTFDGSDDWLRSPKKTT